MTLHQPDLFPANTWFFTLRLAAPGATTLIDHIEQLRLAYAVTTHDLPVQCQAMVVLPDHLHAIWTEAGEPRFAKRWRRIRARFAQGVGGKAGLWQAGVRHHAIASAEEFDRRMTYCRMDAVKHGLVGRWQDWPCSSFTRVPAVRPRQAAMAFARQGVAA